MGVRVRVRKWEKGRGGVGENRGMKMGDLKWGIVVGDDKMKWKEERGRKGWNTGIGNDKELKTLDWIMNAD